jgi:hypothetical protein
MSREDVPSWTGITNRFGPRALPEGKAGAFNTGGDAKVQYVLEFDGDTLGTTSDDLIITAGFKPLRVIVEVTAAGALDDDGMTPAPVIVIGTDGTEVTNGFVITEASAEAVGVYVITSFAGSWAAALAASTTVGIALSGDGTVTSAGGVYRVVIEGYLA